MKSLFLLALMVLSQIIYGKTYGVFVGLSNYRDSTQNLPTSVSMDAKVMYSFICSLEDSNRDNCTLLTNENATKRNIIHAIEKQFLKAKEEDLVLFVYSGHGLSGGFTTYEFGNDELLLHDEIKALFKKSKSKTKFCFANACHSGSMKTHEKVNKIPIPNIVDQEVLVFMSSQSNEYSFCPDHGTGFFFQRVLEAFRGEGNSDTNEDGVISAYELFRYVYDKVVEDTYDLQHPVMFGKFEKEMPIIRY